MRDRTTGKNAQNASANYFKLSFNSSSIPENPNTGAETEQFSATTKIIKKLSYRSSRQHIIYFSQWYVLLLCSIGVL